MLATPVTGRRPLSPGTELLRGLHLDGPLVVLLLAISGLGFVVLVVFLSAMRRRATCRV